VNGDPDRPLVTGRVFNAYSMPPWDLPGNATQSGIISRSMKGGKANYSGIRFDDKQGAEEFMLQAEKDMNSTVKHDEVHNVGNDRTKRIGQNETVTIGGMQKQTIGGDTTLTTTGPSKGGAGSIGDIQLESQQGRIRLKATTEIIFEVGSSTIHMKADGNIVISGPTHVNINPG